MSGIAGRSTLVKVSTSSGSGYNTVAGLKSANHSIDAAAIDDNEFGVVWVQKIQGLKDGKLSLSGQYRPSDTTGQVVIQTSLLDDSDLFVEVLFDGTNGWRQQMRCSKFAADASLEGIVGVSIELEGTGAITAVP